MTIYWINNSTGNDANTGTKASPWATLSKFQTTAVSGDTAMLVAGTGVDYLSSEFLFDCTIKNAGGGVVTVKNSTAGADAFRVYGAIVTLVNLTPKDASTSGQSAYRTDSSGRINIYYGQSLVNCDRAVNLATPGAYIYAENTAFSGKAIVSVGNSAGEIRNCTGVNAQTEDFRGTQFFGFPTTHWHSILIGNSTSTRFVAAQEFFEDNHRFAVVDPVSGNDANWVYGAPESSPVKNIAAALGIPGVSVIYIINPGAGVPIELNESQQLIGRKLKIVGRTITGYEPVIIDGSKTYTNWTLSSGSMWQRTMSTVNTMWDQNTLDAQNEYSALTPTNSTVSCESTPGTFFHDSGAGVMYVHLSDGGDPNSRLRIPVAGNIFTNIGGILELVNLKVTGANAEGVLTRSGGGVKAYSCYFNRNGANGAEVTTGSEGYFERCDFFSNGIPEGFGDGLGNHNQSNVRAVRCRMRSNKDDGASPHHMCTMILENCEIEGNDDRGFVGIEQAYMEMRGGYSINNGAGTGVGQNISCESSSKMYLENVQAYGQPVGAENIRSTNNAKSTLRSVKDQSGGIITPITSGGGTASVQLDDRDLVVISAQNAALL